MAMIGYRGGMLLTCAAALASCATMPSASSQTPPAPPVAFRIDEGSNINAFARQGPVAAHMLLRSGADPRILIAFPAGNSGTALWFKRTARPVTWTLDEAPVAETLADAQGRPLHGVRAIASIDAPALRFRQAVLSSVRVLRDYELLRTAPAEVLVPARAGGNDVTWARDRLDGAAGYRLALSGLDGTRVTDTGLIAGPSGRIRIAIRAASGEQPLTPLGGDGLITGAANDDPRARNALSFLSYDEKYLAGSWRFLTYFGRDTLMSLRLLMPVLQPRAMADGIGSVLTRLAANGEVAHEEDIGEFAVLRNAKEGRGRIATPIYDYAMVDDDFMLAPVVAAWALERDGGRDAAARFLASPGAGGVRQGDLLVRNFAWVIARSAAFARDPRVANLVGFKDGRLTGQWRDSEEGLGRGTYAYDVNAVFVPAALDAIARLGGSGLLAGYGTAAERARLGDAAGQADAWQRTAPPLFAATLPPADARRRVGAYARTVGVDAAPALASLTGPLSYNALALDAQGRQVPVIHSDDGFALLFARPDAAALERSVRAMMRPFPAGLLTGVGVVVANPALASAEVQGRFGANAYHGTVVWSWQQAVLAAGLARQLERGDLPPATRTLLRDAQRTLWRAIRDGREVQTSELWSWRFAGGRYQVAPFGAQSGDADESNAAQLWSTVFLAISAPDGD